MTTRDTRRFLHLQAKFFAEEENASAIFAGEDGSEHAERPGSIRPPGGGDPHPCILHPPRSATRRTGESLICGADGPPRRSFIMLARGASEVVYCTQSAGRGNAPVHRVRTFALQHCVASRCEAPFKCRGPVERQNSHPSGKILWTTMPLLSHAHTKRHRSIECRTKNTEFDVCFLPTRSS